MSQLGRLVISLEASTAQFTAAMTKAEAQAAASMEAISGAAKIAGGVLGGLVGAFSLNTVMDWSKGVIAGASALDDLQDVTGSSVENLSKLKNQMDIAGKDFDSVATLVAKLAAGMAGAEDDTTKVGHALKTLGIEARDPAEALQEIAVKLNTYRDDITKAALAKDLFGQKAIQFLAQLKDIAAMQDVAATVTAQQAAEAEKLEQGLRRLSVESTTFKNALLSEVVPALNGMIERFREARAQGEGFLKSLDVAMRGSAELGANITTLTANIAGMRAQLQAYQATTPSWMAAYSSEVAGMTANIEKARKELALLISLRDKGIMTNVAMMGYTGDSRDQRAQNSAASISKEVLAYESLAKATTKAKEATYDFEKELEKLYNQLDNNAGGINDEFLTKLYMLQGVFEAGDMTLEQYRQRVEALIKSTKYGADAIAKLEEAAKANNRAFDDAFDSIERARIAVENSIRGARLMVEQMEFENSTLTMTNQEREIAIGLRALELQGIQKGTEAYEIFAQRIREAVETKNGLQAQIQIWRDIEIVATNAIENIIVRGMSGFKDLWENFKAWALRAIAQIAAQRIVVPIVGSMLGLSGGTANAAFGGSGGSLGGSILNLLGGGGGSLFGSLSSGLGGVLAGMETGFTTLGIALTEGTAAVGGLSSALGALGAVAGPIAGIALAAYAAWQVFGNKGGGPKGGGFYSMGDTTGIYGTDNSGRWFTPSTEDSTVKTIVEATAASYAALLKQLGGKGSGGFALGFDTDPDGTAPNRVHAGAWVNGVQVYNAALGDLGRDAEKLKATLELESKRAVLAAIQASDLPEDIAAIIDALSASTATSDMIDNTIAFAQAIHGLNEILKSDPVADAMDAVTRATEGSYAALMRSGDVMRDLVATYDGSTEATQQLATATAAYYQQQVALLVQIEQVRQAVESMFGDTIRSLTLTTLDDPGKYDFLMNEANSLMDQLATETDPDKIRALSQRINQDILDAFGLLSPDDQRSMLGQFTGYAQAVSDAVSTRLSQIGDEARQTVGDVLALVKDAFQQAVNDFVNAATTQQTAADTQLAAANTPVVVEVNVAGLAGAVNA